MKDDKRKDYFTWDETFIHIAFLISQRSKDPNTQNGACVVDEDNIIIGLGYNGFPRGCHDDELPWIREGNLGESKYAYVVHAEENALLNATGNTRNARIYCTLFPCNECAKVIIQKGIKEVIYDSDKYHDSDICKASRKMFDMAGVKYWQYIPKSRIQFRYERMELFIESEE